VPRLHIPEGVTCTLQVYMANGVKRDQVAWLCVVALCALVRGPILAVQCPSPVLPRRISAPSPAPWLICPAHMCPGSSCQKGACYSPGTQPTRLMRRGSYRSFTHFQLKHAEQNAAFDSPILAFLNSLPPPCQAS
jgi:hypothetical protein